MSTIAANAPAGTLTVPETKPDATFRSIFACPATSVTLKIPDYQRAFSWEEAQTGLFLADLLEYQGSGRAYYFGHFIVENRGHCWEIVDGQQRITLFALFLLVCRHHHPAPLPEAAVSFAERFSTVSYDMEAFECIAANMGAYFTRGLSFDAKNPPNSEILGKALALTGEMTRSQRRIVLALLQIDKAFAKGELNADRIPAYINVILDACCSLHLTREKSVAVNVFEMHNTRGVPLATLEIVKAMLMKFVYDNGATEAERTEDVESIQREFGQIYGMEEQLAQQSFRGHMTTDQLLRHHLRAVDDNNKRESDHYRSPAFDASADSVILHIRKRLRFEEDGKTPRSAKDGVAYALALARELKSSMLIVSRHLPEWDRDDSRVGDVLILEPGWSCEFFLIACRRLSHDATRADGRLSDTTIKQWEEFLFIRDFHDAYYRLRYKDDFPRLFSQIGNNDLQVSEIIGRFLDEGFRDRTAGLRGLVDTYLVANRPNILNNAFYWWKGKMVYALYKYEVAQNPGLRPVMKRSPSVEHILPQDWKLKWIDGYELAEPNGEEGEKIMREIGTFINGLGNLILLTREQNTSAGNTHPADKRYPHHGGSYSEHNGDPERWRSSGNWVELIHKRGTRIFDFIRQELVGGAGPEGNALARLQETQPAND